MCFFFRFILCAYWQSWLQFPIMLSRKWWLLQHVYTGTIGLKAERITEQKHLYCFSSLWKSEYGSWRWRGKSVDIISVRTPDEDEWTSFLHRVCAFIPESKTLCTTLNWEGQGDKLEDRAVCHSVISNSLKNWAGRKLEGKCKVTQLHTTIQAECWQGITQFFREGPGDAGEPGLEHESVVQDTEKVNHNQVYMSKHGDRKTKEVPDPEWRRTSVSTPYLELCVQLWLFHYKTLTQSTESSRGPSILLGGWNT